MASIDFGMCYQAILGPELECGDIAVIKQYDNQCLYCINRCVGHGSAGKKNSYFSEKYLENNYKNIPY